MLTCCALCRILDAGQFLNTTNSPLLEATSLDRCGYHTLRARACVCVCVCACVRVCVCACDHLHHSSTIIDRVCVSFAPPTTPHHYSYINRMCISCAHVMHTAHALWFKSVGEPLLAANTFILMFYFFLVALMCCQVVPPGRARSQPCGVSNVLPHLLVQPAGQSITDDAIPRFRFLKIAPTIVI